MSRGQRRAHAMLWLIFTPILLLAIYWAYQSRVEYSSDAAVSTPAETSS